MAPTECVWRLEGTVRDKGGAGRASGTLLCTSLATRASELVGSDGRRDDELSVRGFNSRQGDVAGLRHYWRSRSGNLVGRFLCVVAGHPVAGRFFGRDICYL